MMIVVFASLVALSGIQQVHGRSSGAPDTTCTNLVPDMNAHQVAATVGFPGGFYIISNLVDDGGNYIAGQTYNVELQTIGRQFRGFLIQVRDASNQMLIGTFSFLGGLSQLVNCPGNGMATVTHTSNVDKSMVQFNWTAPSDMNGTAIILYTVVVTAQEPYYAAMNAANFRPPPPGCPAQRHALSEFPFYVGLPSNCMRENCDYFLALGPTALDSNSVEIYLEGNAMGWIAVGFSNNTLMNETDVLGCNVDSSSIVNVVDTWNPSPNYSPNEADMTNSSLCVYQTMFNGNRISCQFSRTIMAQNLTEDFDLNQPYWLFYGRRLTAQNSSESFETHRPDGNPALSAARINPSQPEEPAPPAPPPVQNPCPSAPANDVMYTFTQGNPSDPFYFGARINDENPDYVDMILQANTDGWVAVGFSDTSSMDAADVLGCIRSGVGDEVLIRDSWNIDVSVGGSRGNVFDSNQDGVCPYSSSFSNGRISCTFSRFIPALPDGVSQSPVDLALNGSWFQMFGTGNSMGTSSFPVHQSTPSLTNGRINLFAEMVNPGQMVPPCPSAPADDVTYTFTEGTPTDPFYFGSRVNDEDSRFLDMILQADTDGWVAVGFSATRDMDAADVLGCIRSGGGDDVLVRDAWNFDVSTGAARGNGFDSSQDGVCPYSASFSNGRISCTFSRFIPALPDTVSTEPVDLSLNGSWFQMYGTGSSIGIASFPRHESTPSLTSGQVSLIADAGSTIFPQCELTQTHGIFMIVAWPLLVTVAIFLAAWMKPALPNGEWFQVHRIFMIISLFITAAGFIFIFVANLGFITFSDNPKGTAHFVIGIIVFALQIANPIIALFRCAPSGSNRWIFNLSHGTVIGLSAELLALTNVGIGIALFESGSGCSTLGDGGYTILWVYIAYIVFTLILQFIMFIIFAIVAANAELPERRKLAPSFIRYFYPAPPPKEPASIEMTSPDKEKSKQPDAPARKPPSDDAYLRWGGFGIYVSVTFILMLAIIILIAVLP